MIKTEKPETKLSDFLSDSPLGKVTAYQYHYSPDFLFSVPREISRRDINICDQLPFHGFDLWNGYELSWLNPQGKPMVGVIEFIIPCESKYLIESKTIKYYLNSFSNTQFDNIESVAATIQKDFSDKTQSSVAVKVIPLSQLNNTVITSYPGFHLDQLDIETNEYVVNPNFLTIENKWVEEILYSDLLKSNCPVTGQPDWGSVQIHYRGKNINRENLLKYIISFRNHTDFHEHCVERIFMDIMSRCQPEMLAVSACYTRRGGIDINPVRSTDPSIQPTNLRLVRQ